MDHNTQVGCLCAMATLIVAEVVGFLSLFWIIPLMLFFFWMCDAPTRRAQKKKFEDQLEELRLKSKYPLAYRDEDKK